MIHINMPPQPDDETCGPTCLQAIYDYYGLRLSLDEVIGTVERSLSGGTLSALLGKHALQQGFNATIYVNDLSVFDPTWFYKGNVDREFLSNKLIAQMGYKNDIGIVQTSRAYLQYIQLGGQVRLRTLCVALLKKYFDQNIPILTGISATYLYSSARECYTQQGVSFYDDIRGTPCGHFVVLCGYDEDQKHIVVADPQQGSSLSDDHYYTVHIHRLIHAILLGVFTYDANLLIIEPKRT